MSDGIYSQLDTSIGYKLYPSEKLLKRKFNKEMMDVSFNKYPEITIVTLFCGRFHCLAPYFWSLGNMDYDKKKIHLVMYCSTPMKVFYNVLRSSIKKISHAYASVKIVWDRDTAPSKLAYGEKNEDVMLHLDNIPRLYNKAIKYVNTRYLFSFEDDQINPSHTIKRHLRAVKLNKVSSSCGVAFDRHHNNLPVAFDFYMEADGNIRGVNAKRRFCLTPVGSGGFGSTVIDRDKTGEIEFTHRVNDAPDLLGSDVCFGYEQNKKGNVILYDWDVNSFHLNSQGAIC